MGSKTRIVYISMVSVFAGIVVLAMLIGLWMYAIFGIVFGGLFAYSAHFVFAKKWEPPEPAPTRRPVKRRRYI